nr:PREDICTED: peptide transporter family 1-like isoform X1 [Bemisia tabaci]
MTAEEHTVRSAQETFPYPKSTFFINSHALCQRYSFYGVCYIAALYLRDNLKYTEGTATQILHVVYFLLSALPIIGGTLADSNIGMYKAIIVSTLIHLIGNTILPFASTPWLITLREFSLLGMFLTAIGAGLLRPILSTFGGEQFVLPQQAKQLATYFSIFYFSCQVGPFFAAITSPIIRRDVKCFGQKSCYPLAFGIPAIVMAIGFVLLVCGRRRYTVPQSGESILLNMLKCIFYALRRRISSNKPRKNVSHWLEYAGDKFDPELLTNAKDVLNVLVMYIPTPMFFALHDQVISSWVYQASKMDGVVPNWFTIQADQMNSFNPICCMLFIPLLELVIYPALAKVGIKRPLQYITIGALLCASSFVLAAYVEYKQEPCYAQLPSPGQGQLRIFNGLPCPVDINFPDKNNHVIPAHGDLQWTDLQVQNTRKFNTKLALNEDFACRNIIVPKSWMQELSIFEEKSVSYILTVLNATADIQRIPGYDDVSKSQSNVPVLRVIHNLEGNLVLKNQYGGEFVLKLSLSDPVTSMIEVDSASYQVVYENEIILSDLPIKSGGVYTLVLQKIDSKITGSIHIITPPATLHMLWMLPQTIILAFAELMFQITYLSFIFTEAPEKMKCIMSSLFSLSMAFGSVIVVLITRAGLFHRQSLEFLFYAGLMLLDVMLLILLSVRYKYRNLRPIKNDEMSKKELESDMKAVTCDETVA